MSELVERYVHQVGRLLPPKERNDIQAELRSLIQDQLEDRYPPSPSQAEVAAVLAELGDPRQMAASYGGQQYLIGPDLYPNMMRILRFGWLLVPTVVVILNGIAVFSSSQQGTVLGLFIETIFTVAQATFTFSAVVVLIFAIIQHSGVELDEKEAAFNPLDLPEADDPGSVDQFEAASGIAFGTFVALVSLYFLRVGGLTLRFNLDDPGEVIPFPTIWMLLLIISGCAMIILHVVVLRRNRWSIGMWLAESLLETFGMVCLYFVLLEPLFKRIATTDTSLNDLPFVQSIPELIAIGYIAITQATRGATLVKIWNYRNNHAPFSPTVTRKTK